MASKVVLISSLTCRLPGRSSLFRLQSAPLIKRPIVNYAAAALTSSTVPSRSATTVSGSAVKESKHWYKERVVSIALLALMPAGVVYPSAVVDWGLAVALPLHNYWGVNQIIADYVHGKTILPVAKVTWTGVSLLTVAGLCYINYNDVGICKVVAGIFAV